MASISIVRRSVHAADDTDAPAPAPTPQSLRIAMIAPPWVSVPPTAYGGTESVIDTLCRGLTAAGHQVLLVATADSTCPVERASFFESGLGIDAASSAADIEHAAFGYATAAEWGAQIIHDHTLAGPPLGALTAAAPVVTTCHGPFASDLALVYRLMSRHVPVVAISWAQAAAAEQIAIAAVIHHGVDLADHPMSASGGDFVMFLGRMSPDKGIDVAIDVANEAGVPLVIGAKMREPLEVEYFEQVIRPKLGPNIDFVGEVDRPTQRDLLARAACLLNPIQWNEPFGLVAIEAMAAGTPVVTTPHGAMPEIVVDGRTGFVRESVEDLADAVRKATHLDRNDCRRHVEECFSMDLMATNHARFYQHVLDAHGLGLCS